MSATPVQIQGQIIEGTRYSVFLNPANVLYALSFDPEEGDVIEVTYPRTGSTWVQQIIQLILNRGSSAQDYMEFTQRSPFLEFQGKDALETLPSPRLIRTHLPLGRIQFSSKAKYVYVARNPWDTCASLYQIGASFLKSEEEFPFDLYFETFIKGEDPCGDYFDHVLSGYQRRHEPNLFFMTYEQLKADTPGTVIKLAYFLGDEHGKALEETEDLLNSVLSKSTVEFLKTITKTTHGNVLQRFWKNPAVPVPVNDATTELNTVFPLVNKGIVGAWRQRYSRDHLRKMEERIAKVTRTSDVMRLWEKEWALVRKAAE